MKNITSKHNILITGASSGIGKELALLYIAKGHKVALLARRLPLLEEIKESIPSPLKENVRLYQCDVTRKEAVQKTLSHCIEKMGIKTHFYNQFAFVSSIVVEFYYSKEIKRFIFFNKKGKIGFIKFKDIMLFFIFINSLN